MLHIVGVLHHVEWLSASRRQAAVDAWFLTPFRPHSAQNQGGFSRLTPESAPRWRDLLSPAALTASIRRYSQSGVLDSSILTMIQALADQQARLAEECGDAAGPESTPSDPSPTPPATWLASAAEAVGGAIAASSPKAAPAVASLGQHLCSLEPADLQALLDGEPSAVQSFAASAALPVDAALYLLRAALQPWVAVHAGAKAHSLSDQPYPPRLRCPACGAAPMMGKHLEDDGHRFLRCADCGNEWAFPRIGCPGCGELSAGRIDTLYDEDDPGHRLYLCNTCMHYLKISDERLLGGRVHLPLEDIVTTRLDELAATRGYRPVADTIDLAGEVKVSNTSH